MLALSSAARLKGAETTPRTRAALPSRGASAKLIQPSLDKHPSHQNRPPTHGILFVFIRVHSWFKTKLRRTPHRIIEVRKFRPRIHSLSVSIRDGMRSIRHEALVKQDGVWKLSKQLVGE